jgi:collagen type IV alpha
MDGSGDPFGKRPQAGGGGPAFPVYRGPGAPAVIAPSAPAQQWAAFPTSSAQGVSGSVGDTRPSGAPVFAPPPPPGAAAAAFASSAVGAPWGGAAGAGGGVGAGLGAFGGVFGTAGGPGGQMVDDLAR